MEMLSAKGGRLLRLREVEEKTSLGRSTIYRYMDENRFPRPLQLSPGAVRWLEAEIDAWAADLPRTTRR